MTDPSLCAWYEELAVAVIERAIADFYQRVKTAERFTRQNLRDKHNRLEVARRRVEAGEFLLSRTDDVARLWFALADLSLQASHRNTQGFHTRLRRARKVLHALKIRKYQKSVASMQAARDHMQQLKSVLVTRPQEYSRETSRAV